MLQNPTFTPTQFIVDQDQAAKVKLHNNCLIFHASNIVFWKRSQSGNLQVLATRSSSDDAIELFQVASDRCVLPIGCGLVTICGEKTDFNNACALFQFSEDDSDYRELLEFDGEHNNFVGLILFSPAIGETVNDIIDQTDAL
jgi:hypothetical protein